MPQEDSIDEVCLIYPVYLGWGRVTCWRLNVRHLHRSGENCVRTGTKSPLVYLMISLAGLRSRDRMPMLIWSRWQEKDDHWGLGSLYSKYKQGIAWLDVKSRSVLKGWLVQFNTSLYFGRYITANWWYWSDLPASRGRVKCLHEWTFSSNLPTRIISQIG